MAFLVEHLPPRVRDATLALGLVKSEKSRVPRRLAKLLTYPLFDLPEQDVKNVAIVPDAMFVAEAVDFAVIEKQEPIPPWTAEGVLKLHSVLLEESLRALAGRGNGEQKQEILEWVFESDLIGSVTRNGRQVQVRNSQVPWSFAFCCKLEGMDPDHIRDRILTRMPAEARMFFH